MLIRYKTYIFILTFAKLFLTLERENLSELNLVICYDDENGRLLQHYDRSTYSVDYGHPIDANGESYSIVDKSFGDYGLSKIYVTQNYICISEEGNNYQFIYSSEYIPQSAHYAPGDNDKIHKLGDNWYLVTPHELSIQTFPKIIIFCGHST